MFNFPLISKAVGMLLFLETGMLLLCLGVGIADAGYGADLLTFGVPVGVSALLGFLLRHLGRRAENRLSRRDGYLIVALTWVTFSLIGTLPFLLSGATPRLAAAIFETVSGFTTTGATCLPEIDPLSQSLLLWRSLTHWIGGMGIVFFTIAVLPHIGGSDLKLFTAESTGLRTGKLHPRISTTARWLLSVYLFLTISCTSAYFLCGMSFGDAVNHALSTVSTGGFSTHSASIAHYQSPLLQWVTTVFMLLSGVNFALTYLLFTKRRVKDVFRDEELRFYLRFFFSASLAISATLFFVHHLPLENALRSGFFTVASIQTTTGFTDENFMLWHPVTWVVLLLCSFVCACSGSTSGGVKCVRILMVWKMIRSELRQMLHPHAVIPLRIQHSLITPRMGRTLLVFLSLYVLLIILSIFFFMLSGLPALDAVGLSFTSIGNVGPAIGYTVGALGTWDVLSDAQLVWSSLLMLAGRLEIFCLLLPFVPGFWKDE